MKLGFVKVFVFHIRSHRKKNTILCIRLANQHTNRHGDCYSLNQYISLLKLKKIMAAVTRNKCSKIIINNQIDWLFEKLRMILWIHSKSIETLGYLYSVMCIVYILYALLTPNIQKEKINWQASKIVPLNQWTMFILEFTNLL